MDTDRILLTKEYEAKQRERAAETNPLRKRQLFEEERDLRIRLEIPHPKAGISSCYVDAQPTDLASDFWPFCGESCKERWARLNKYHERTTKGASDLDIRRRQERAIEIAGELRAKRTGGRAVA